MALFDASIFAPQNYQGVSGLLGGMFPYKIPQSAGFAPQPEAQQSDPNQSVDMSARSAPPPMAAESGPLYGAPQGPSLSDRLSAFAHNPAGSRGIIPKILDAVSGLATGVRTDPQGIAIQQLNATYQALRQSGVPDATARAAALNPEILKTVAGAYFDTAPKLQETGADPITGQKSFAVYRPNMGTLTAVNAQGQPGVAGNTVGGIDASLPPDQLLAQSDKRYPGVANRVEQLYRGEGGMPNVRQNPLDRAAMQLIQIVHPDWNMTMWTAKNKMQQQLSSGAPSSLGGRLSALRNAFDHLANVSDSAVAKGNFDLGLSPLSTLANEAKSLTTSQRDIGAKMEREAVTYGGERTKFLTGSEGSEAERRAFLDKLGPDSAAPAQMAGTIEGEYTQLKSALLNQEQQIREQLGEEYLKRHPVVTPEIKEKLDTIERNIAKMRGRAPTQSQSSATTPSATSPGLPKVGDVQQGYRFKGGDPSKPESWERQ